MAATKSPGAPSAAAERRKKRLEAQRKRRAREHVVEAETYAEAAARLREAFGVVDFEAAPAALAPPPSVTPSGDAAGPSEAPPADPAAPSSEPQKPAEGEPQKPPEQASQPAGEAAGEAKPPPASAPTPEVKFDAEKITAAAVSMVDKIAVQEWGPGLALDEQERKDLVEAATPVMREWLKPPEKGLTPQEALLYTAGFIYLPKALPHIVKAVKDLFSDGAPAPEQPAPAEGLRVVPGERTA